jgi:hypothetical protein
MGQLAAKKENFSKAHVVAFRDKFEDFKAFFDPRFKGLSAIDVWKYIGGTVPKKEAKK